MPRRRHVVLAVAHRVLFAAGVENDAPLAELAALLAQESHLLPATREEHIDVGVGVQPTRTERITFGKAIRGMQRCDTLRQLLPAHELAELAQFCQRDGRAQHQRNSADISVKKTRMTPAPSTVPITAHTEMGGFCHGRPNSSNT